MQHVHGVTSTIGMLMLLVAVSAIAQTPTVTSPASKVPTVLTGTDCRTLAANYAQMLAVLAGQLQQAANNITLVTEESKQLHTQREMLVAERTKLLSNGVTQEERVRLSAIDRQLASIDQRIESNNQQTQELSAMLDSIQAEIDKLKVRWSVRRRELRCA